MGVAYKVADAKYLIMYPGRTGNVCAKRLRTEADVQRELYELINYGKYRLEDIEIFIIGEGLKPIAFMPIPPYTEVISTIQKERIEANSNPKERFK